MAEPMSAEDRAIDVIGEWLDDGEAAVAILEALSSEGLVVVAQADLPTPVEARALLRATGDGRLPDLDVSEAELSGCVKLRRLSGADD